MPLLEGCAVRASLLPQNQSSSTESAHANAKAGVSGHCLDSSRRSTEQVSKKKKFVLIQEENWT